MPQFSPDQVSFQDVPGYGLWDINHGREHLQFVQALSAEIPAIVIPDFPLLAYLTGGPARKSLAESHTSAHQLLRQATGVQGFDYTEFDLDNEGDFYSFLQAHAVEHASIRQVLGLT